MSNQYVMQQNEFLVEELTLEQQEMIQGGGPVKVLVKAGKWLWKNADRIAIAAYEVYDAITD